ALPASEVRSLRGLRVAAWFDDAECPVESEYLGLLRRTADALANAGARVEESHPSIGFRDYVDLYTLMVAAAVSPSLADVFGDAVSGTHIAWLRNDARRTEMRAQWAEWFAGYDVLLAPAWTMPAFELGHAGMTDRWLTVNGEARSAFEISYWLM